MFSDDDKALHPFVDSCSVSGTLCLGSRHFKLSSARRRCRTTRLDCSSLLGVVRHLSLDFLLLQPSVRYTLYPDRRHLFQSYSSCTPFHFPIVFATTLNLSFLKRSASPYIHAPVSSPIPLGSPPGQFFFSSQAPFNVPWLAETAPSPRFSSPTITTKVRETSFETSLFFPYPCLFQIVFRCFPHQCCSVRFPPPIRRCVDPLLIDWYNVCLFFPLWSDYFSGRLPPTRYTVVPIFHCFSLACPAHLSFSRGGLLPSCDFTFVSD